MCEINQYLNSFPTRRSSDLCSRAFSACRRRSSGSRAASTACASSAVSSSRSEEHTSELQSRGHLVCRLLLEKKKNLHHHMRIVHQYGMLDGILHVPGDLRQY